MEKVYSKVPRSIWVLYDLRDPEQCKHLHDQRGVWQELSDLAPLGPDYMVLIIGPDAALQEAA